MGAYRSGGSGARQTLFTSEIVSFGTNIYLQGDRNVSNHDVRSDGEARRRCRIAVEAFLIFGRGYNGLDLVAGFARVPFNGELPMRRFFGYKHQECRAPDHWVP